MEFNQNGDNMEIVTTQYKHCDVLKVTGRVDSATSPRLAEELSEIHESGRYKVVMDFSDLEFISSAGMRVLISSLKSSRRYNRGDLVLAVLPENILSVFNLAGFDNVFKIFDDVVSAVGSF